MRKPNLFIIGAMKSGTSSLHSWLGAHPDIFMCEPKEPCYFVNRPDLDWPYIDQLGLWRGKEFYLRLFESAGTRKVIGESSTLYTKAPRIAGVPLRIADFNPDARFIYLMRDPVERAVSHYWHMVRHHGEHRPLEQALRETLDYCDVSHYAMQLRQYIQVFGADRILPLTFEELLRNKAQVVQRIFTWLGVEASFVPPNLEARENATPVEVTQARGRGILSRFRHSRLWCAIGPRVPREIRRIGRSLSECVVVRDSLIPSRVLDWLRPIQRAQTGALELLLDREFPEWSVLYGTEKRPSIAAVPTSAGQNQLAPEECGLQH